MTNLQRLQLEIQGIELSQNEASIYLEESGLTPHDEYNAKSRQSKRAIMETALSILESLSNNPTLMKNYKQDDMTISAFHENLLARIDQLESKIRRMPVNESQNDSNFFMLFKGQSE